ncbi:hypothetical protein [Streptomyces sp. NPDC059816]|uniref:hypothetical protein n=1 Tax=Streptomyces sp. NPDC059816 TaxID=3346960 RepID=UPI0036481FEB
MALLIDKIRDAVGLHPDPPTNAVVFAVDEKPQIQALERTLDMARSLLHQHHARALGVVLNHAPRRPRPGSCAPRPSSTGWRPR